MSETSRQWKNDSPSDWTIERLANIADIVSGGTPSREVPEYWSDGAIPWATPTDITKTHARTISKTADCITEAGLRMSSANILPPGSLLMTSRATLGEMKITQVDICTNQGFKSLVPKCEIDNWFLYYQMMNNKHRYELLGIGSTFLEVNKKDTANFTIELPPLPQQKKIARILSTVDNLIEKTETLIEKYKAIKQGMMHDLFTRGVDQNGKLRPPYEEAPHLYKESPLGWIPNEWDVRPIDDTLLDMTYGLTVRPKYVEEGIPLISGAECRDGWINYDACKKIRRQDFDLLRERSLPKAGHVLITKTGTLGRVAIIRDCDPLAAITQNVALLKPNALVLTSEFLEFVLSSQKIQGDIDQTVSVLSIPDLQLGVLGRFLTPVPPIDEQNQLIALAKTVSEKLGSERQSVSKLQRLKAGLMQDLLTGKVRVNVDEAEEVTADV